MNFLTLQAAWEKAQMDAPGISEDEFFEQTRQHLLNGRIAAAAYDCEYAQGARCEDARVVRRPNAQYERKEIPASEWLHLAIDFDAGGSAVIWGHDRSPEWARDDEDETRWNGGYFDGLPIYTNMIVTAASFEGLWQPAAEPAGERVQMSDDDLRLWIHDKESELGRQPPVRSWQECPELRERGVTKERFQRMWKALYPNALRGRPRKQ